MLAFGFGVGALSIISFILSKSLTGLLFSGFLGDVGEGLGITTLLALLTDIAPANARGGAVGLYRTFMDVGGFLGPIVFMMLYSSYSIDPILCCSRDHYTQHIYDYIHKDQEYAINYLI